MEILILVLLYYLSQNPAFAESVKPLMTKLKDSEQMLNFLNDLSKFSQGFGGFTSQSNTPHSSETHKKSEQNKKDFDQQKQESEKEKTPQSPTIGIADEFIQGILDSYLKSH